uniref:Zinc finger SWIM-type containing 7 n=1 Tax=Gallus gallus TaxID=9031 RepID=A0A8V1APY8_CHICK
SCFVRPAVSAIAWQGAAFTLHKGRRHKPTPWSIPAAIPDDLLLGLKFIFGPSAVPALDLVDQRSVTRVVSPSGRTAYQVLGSSGKLYTCYSSCHFCTCPAFGFTVLQKSESLLCKHILAVYLSQAMGACQELTVSEEQLTSILLAEEEDEG